MSKARELCGKPLDEWPQSKRVQLWVMDGSERMTAWIVASLSLAAVTAIGIGYKACERDKQHDEILQQQCLIKAEDSAACMGAIQTVRCLPSTKPIEK